MQSNQLSDLLQAEKKAESLRSKTKEDSIQRLEKANRDAENLLKKAEQSSRDGAKLILEESLKNSQKEANEQRIKGQAAVKELKNAAEKNMQKAVSVLMNNLDKAI